MGDLTLDVGLARRWLELLADSLLERADELTRLDAAIGDADHGTNMARGFRAVREKALGVEQPDVSSLLKQTGMALIGTVGGAAGPLYGTLFLRMSTALAGRDGLALPDIRDALRAGVQGVADRGKAQPGDKTMLDALLPAVEALDGAVAAGEDAAGALGAAADAAERGAVATVPLQARRGRASYLGERSIGHQDPGATSAALLVRTLAEALSPSPPEGEGDT
ncbi:MAG TPA: dihydroxyacetone kinase subunit DhaL [Candidatus Dormibacteraeota bacterium]|nr:dihydroxyacetone kinase subunit DhaL [Candidatus Dormibacteraeota bacterium]